MLYQIVSLLLDVVVNVVGGACLLRLYMQYQRISMSGHSGNPLGRFIFALTNWVVLPLRRVVPALGRWDLASLLAACLLQLTQFLLLRLLAGANWDVFAVLAMAVFGLLQQVISGMTGLVIIYAVMSWVQTRSVISDLLDRLCTPILRPIRRLIPLVGGVDLSPLALLVLLQIGSLLLGRLHAEVLSVH
jgi:YggT family protein